jgi:hypothetical protein
MTMTLDIRKPIGWLFLIFGVLIGGYGQAHALLSAGINVDLVWGAVLAVFGAAMLWLARRGG